MYDACEGGAHILFVPICWCSVKRVIMCLCVLVALHVGFCSMCSVYVHTISGERNVFSRMQEVCSHSVGFLSALSCN